MRPPGCMWGYHSDAGSTAPTILTYELPSSSMSVGLIFICGYPAKDVEAMFLQNPSVMFNLNGRVLDKSSMDLYPNKKRVRLLRWFGNSGHEKKDMMLLSMEVSVHESDCVEDKSHSCIVSQMLFCGVLWEGLG